MQRISLVLVLAGLMVGLLYSLALACDTCGCQAPGAQATAAAGTAACPGADGCANCPNKGACTKSAGGCAECTKAEGGVCEHCALAKAKDEMQVATTTAAPAVECPMCQEQGGLCEHCQAQATDVLTKMAGAMCPNCEADALCADCQGAVEAALAAYPTLEAQTIMQDEIVVAYLEGTVAGQEALFGQLMAETGKQNLFGSDTMFGSIYPDVMTNGYSMDTTVYAFVTLPAGVEVQAPLKLYTVPAGSFLNVMHHGSYDTLGVSWMDAFVYADMHGLALGSGPAGEVYVTNPETTPETEWLTEIYIPLSGGEVEMPMEAMGA